MAEIRYIYWDGIPNVKPDGTVENQNAGANKQSLAQKKKTARAIRRSEPNKRGKNVVAFTEPGVKIISTDEWFVPVHDLLAIKIEFNAFPMIKSMLLRIYTCDNENSEIGYKVNNSINHTGSDHFTKLVYQKIFESDELDKLPKNDTSIKEDKSKKDARTKNKNKEPISCLTHCKVVAWIATLRDEFKDVDGKVELDEFRLGPDSIRLRNGNQLKVGFSVDETMTGCEFIENIMGNKTSLKVFDKEPTDSSWIGNKEQKGLGTSFPKFKSQIREGLYHICAKSKIAMALIRAIANEKESKSVSIFPADTVYYSIGGCAIGNYKFTPAGGAAQNINIKDDYSAHLHIEEVKKEIKAGNLIQNDDPNWRPGGNWDATYEKEEGPLDFAAKRYVFSKIGASSQGKGCPARFYFNEKTINMLLDDTYRVVHHEKIASSKILLNGREQQINIAAAVKDSKDVERTIETPFFLALAHEMIHARRIQLGLNAEWDGIDVIINPLDYDGTRRHPSSMVEQLRAKVGTNGLTKDGVLNLMSRYAPYNREEWDTIEGGGAPVVLDKKIFDDLVAKGVIDQNDKTNNPNEVRVTENLIRKELKLNPRYRYVDNPTTNATPPKVLPDSDLDKKISTPRKLISKPQTPDIGSNLANKIHKEIDNLIEKDGGMPHRELITLKPDINYFVQRSARFSLAKRFKSVAKLPLNEAEWDKQDKNFVDGVFEQIIQNESNTSSFSTQGVTNLNEIKNDRPPGRVEDSPKAIWLDNKFLKEANTIDAADIQKIIDNSNGKLVGGTQIKFAKSAPDENDKVAIYDALLRDEKDLLNALSVTGRNKAAITMKPKTVIVDSDKTEWINKLIAKGPNLSQPDRDILIKYSDNKLAWKNNAFAPKMFSWNDVRKIGVYDELKNNDADIKKELSNPGKAEYNTLIHPKENVLPADKAEWVDKIIKETFDSVDFKPIADRSGGGIKEEISLKIAAQNPDLAAKAEVYDALITNQNNILSSVSPAGETKLKAIYSGIPSPTFTSREKADHVLRFLQKAFWFSDDDLTQTLKIYTKIEEARGGDAGVDCFAGYNMDPKVVPIDNNLGREPNPASRAAAFMNVHWANDPIENVRHALVHEPMHMFSFGGTGFSDWQINAGINGAAIEQLMKNIPGGSEEARLSNLRSVLDEGATELFARIICFRINNAENDRIFIITRLDALPYYEWPVHLVCQLVRDLKHLKGKDVGFQILAKAFYDGKWDAFNDALFELKNNAASYSNRYIPEFWQYASDLVISNELFMNRGSVPSAAVEKFRTKFGLNMMHGDEVKKALDDGSYRDPVCYKYDYAGGNWTYILDPVISSNMDTCCERKVNKPLTQGQQSSKPVEKISVCLHCKQRINVPVKTIMKS